MDENSLEFNAFSFGDSSSDFEPAVERMVLSKKSSSSANIEKNKSSKRGAKKKSTKKSGKNGRDAATAG